MPFDSQLKLKWCKHFSFNGRKRTVLWSTYVMTSLRRFSGLSTESAIPRRDPVRAGGHFADADRDCARGPVGPAGLWDLADIWGL